MMSWKVHASYINRTVIRYVLETVQENGHINRINCSIDILVSGPQRLLDRIFKGTIPFLIGFISIQMGILLDIDVLKEIFRRPIPVVIGFTCQYGLMPLIAFAISKIFHYSPLYGLGIFVVGCCPGGAISNQWTVMFDGDLNLSAFMSFASTVASFFMMPLWLYTLGQYAYLRELKLYIPFKNLAISLITIIGPLAVGMVIVHFIPKIKKLVQRILKPTLVLLICYFVIFGGYVNVYLFKYINLQTALTAPLLPWLGFLLGGVVAWICRQDWSRVKTIGIETGIQNVGIAFMVLLYSFPAPENSQASVIPLVIAYLSPQPFYILLIVRFIRKKCIKKNKKTTAVLKAEVDNMSDDIQSKTIHQLIESNEVQESDEDEHRENAPLTAVSVMDKSPDTKPVEV
ncbi:unnamed protein product [Rotaria sordida]|uniref:Ileal sodium/bile acid cotransporter n=1 Tax=Rotaria sordida TaxID=392033 RepID=A0A819MFW3_9BILA|nr:unnamed protein product [Rotaria sordida]CAF1374414.1 unnamed protein product [Rotaria sordida]CAF1517289.1 unnamed protein product [Rotaria sordida]CAF3868212.1 unnamed protein product [Rotaria sordida]CAF3980073.1 unnamed protein product [Rotaria sordida]